ncbi:WD and tetratricopeptide repeats protein 1 isoform X2, partial [Tanacetum coccineum]
MFEHIHPHTYTCRRSSWKQSPSSRVYHRVGDPSSKGQTSATRYTSNDAMKFFNPTVILKEVQSKPPVSDFPNCSPSEKNLAARLDRCQELLQIAEKSLKEGANFYYGIEACNDVLHGHGQIGHTLIDKCLCLRASLLLKRNWKNDPHMAVRDCYRAMEINPNSFRAFKCMAEALSQLGKHKEALDFATASQFTSPYNPEAAEMVENIKKQMDTDQEEVSNKAKEGASNSETRASRILSLSDILYRSDASSDTSQPMSGREGSDYDEEMEADFEASISGDESHEVDSNSFQPSLNVRIRRRGDSALTGQLEWKAKPCSNILVSDNLAQQLSSIASKLNTLDALAADVAVLKAQAGPNGSNRGKSVTLGSCHRDDDSESTNWYRNSTRRPFTKIEFPKFQGGGPRGWILKAEKYFRYYETLDETKVEIASMYLEGTIQEYRQEFAKRVTRVHDWPDHCLLGVFLSGLKEELKVDSKNWERERENRRDKGLCFLFNEKFAPEHRCKPSTFSLLEVSNYNEQLVDREVEANENEYEEGINQQDMAEISFHVFLGKTSGTTMKVEGALEGRKVLILVDSGSTHNFISASLVKQLGLKVSMVPSYRVQIGNDK